jgi:Spy/CpxP family protein refolding chaperone
MLNTKRLVLFPLVLSLVAMAAFVGCNRDETVTDANLNTDLGLVADPLDGVLNSTLNYTPADLDTRIDRLAEALGLDPEQTEALREAYTEFRTGIAALRDQVRSGDLTFAEARERARVLRDAFEAQLQVILTPEQYDQLQEMRQNRHHHKRGHRDPQDRWAAWLEEIGADEDQVAAIMDAWDAYRTGLMDLHSQVRNGELTIEEAFAEAKELRDAFDAALQDILTPEQYEALLELRPDCGRK